MSKSSKERGKTPNSVNQSTPTFTPQNAIIPGKFTIADWLDICEDENVEELVAQIVSEVTQNACNKIFEKIIEERTQLYAVLALKWTLLDVIEWRFLESTPNPKYLMNDFPWNEDIEPTPSKIDNWAQGAVPYVSSIKKENITENSNLISEDIKNESLKSESLCSKDLKLNEEFFQSSNESNEKLFSQNLKVESKPLKVLQTNSVPHSPNVGFSAPHIPKVKLLAPQPPKAPVSRCFKKKSKLYNANSNVSTTLTANHISNQIANHSLTNKSIYHQNSISSPLENKIAKSSVPNTATQPLAEVHNGRKETKQTHNERQKPEVFERLDLNALPSYRVRPKYSICEPIEKQTRLKKQPSIKKFGDKQSSIDKTTTVHRRLSPPMMVDIIDLAEGVTVKEGEFIKKKSLKSISAVTDNERECILHPIRSSLPALVNLSEVIDSSPITRRSTAV